jgi:hypothetical protein
MILKAAAMAYAGVSDQIQSGNVVLAYTVA